MSSKQVIVMKQFPKERHLRTGKYCSQAAHAAVGALFSIAQINEDKLIIDLSNEFIREWIVGRFKKVTVYVKTDQELIDIYNNAKSAGLPCCLIKDAGLTEFSEPTLTAVGIGPDNSDKIDLITGNLPLF
jgi:PTH2 family peptidyl-tRNA hydrolase